ncbi:MAG: PTS transporter subunit EIIC [Erysipelotrichaceae bacterium]|jgi:PTS system cellobiose-specific IIC component|nr:PTS transporter subunit EIIC [Erysipelotrichaceae bacterium]
MKKLISWLETVFAPKLNHFLKRPFIAGVASATQKLLPFILTGCLVFFYNVFRSYFPALPDLSQVSNYSFGLLGLTMSYLVAYQCMEKLDHPRYEVNAGLTAIAVTMMLLFPSFNADGQMVIDFGRLGATGLLNGMVVGIFVSIVFHLYSKLHILENSVSIPDFLIEWVNNIVPIFITLAIVMILVFNLKIDVFQVIINFFMPLQAFGQTYWGMVLLMLIPAICYSMGVSSWAFGAVATPIYLAGMQANLNAVAAGLAPLNIVTNETHYGIALITMGGMGATLGLNFLMLFSKSKKLKSMGKICIGPSIFNINEPIMYSCVVFNPILMLPVWINAFVGPTIIWFVMKLGLLNIPSIQVNVGQVPAPISSVMFTNDWRAIIWYVVLFIVYLAIWYPFFKVYEKQLVKEEAE